MAAEASGPLYVAYSRPEAPVPPGNLRAVTPGEWIQVWRRARVPPTVKGVGFALATFADWNDGTRIRPGNATLANICGEVHPKTIERAIAVIRGYDLIWRYVEGSRKGKEGINDEYRLTIPGDILTRIPLLNPDHSVPPEHRLPARLTTGRQRPVGVDRQQIWTRQTVDNQRLNRGRLGSTTGRWCPDQGTPASRGRSRTQSSFDLWFTYNLKK